MVFYENVIERPKTVKIKHSFSLSFNFFYEDQNNSGAKCQKCDLVLTDNQNQHLKFKAGTPLDLSLWSFLTFLHHGMDKVERHLL